MVAFTCGRCPTAAAMRSALRSWSRRRQPAAKPRRGSNTVSSVSPSRVICAASSSAARDRRRSGQSMMSSGRRDSPRRLQSCSRAAASSGSTAKCTARRWSGDKRPGVLDGPGRGQVHAVDQHHHHVVAQHRRLARLGGTRLELLVLLDVLPVQAQQDHDAERHEDDDDPGPLGELGHDEDEEHHERQHRGGAVDDDTAPPVRLTMGQVELHHPRPGHGEPGEHPDGVEGDQAVELRPGDEQDGDRHRR